MQPTIIYLGIGAVGLVLFLFIVALAIHDRREYREEQRANETRRHTYGNQGGDRR